MTNVKAELLGHDDETGIERYRLTGEIEGRRLDAVLECETDGRDAWWDDEAEPCETAGVDPGDDDTGWTPVLEAINEALEAAL